MKTIATIMVLTFLGSVSFAAGPSMPKKSEVSCKDQSSNVGLKTPTVANSKKTSVTIPKGKSSI